MTNQATLDYGYSGASPSHAHDYLLPVVDRLLVGLWPDRVFDLGGGNGSVAAHLAAKHDVTGVDASPSGIEQVRLAFPGIRLDAASAYDNLSGAYGQFDAVVSLEFV